MKRAIVTGMIATYPVGGVAWDYGQYALGLERLGYEVYYLEDTGGPTYDPAQGLYGEDATYSVRFLRDALTRLSPTLGERWHFRAMDGRTFGIEPEQLRRIVADADLFLNVSGGTLLRDEYMANPCKIIIDTDPGWNHFVNYPAWDAKPGWQGTNGYRAHDGFFTYAERIGRPDCVLPDMGLVWHPTRPPVVMDRWQPDGRGDHWTTVMTWSNFGRTVEYQGVQYGTKEREFGKIELLPQRISGVEFEIAAGGSGVPIERWKELGWHVCDAQSVSHTVEDYRQYIQRSRGEFSVAKNLYVATRSGWFSCRSVCYLAAGRPVVVQDTGFSDTIPTGGGLFAFTDLDEAAASIQEVERNYAYHQRAAVAAAHEHFSAERVLRDLLTKAGIS